MVAKRYNKIGFSGVPRRKHRRNGLMLVMLMYHDHLQLFRTNEVLVIIRRFSYFGAFYLKKWMKCVGSKIFWRTHGRDGLKKESGDIFSFLFFDYCLVCQRIYAVDGDCANTDALIFFENINFFTHTEYIARLIKIKNKEHDSFVYVDVFWLYPLFLYDWIKLF